jgi:holo-[acyl-carrier protein] synthase
MIRGLGVDIVRIDRLASWLDEPRLLERYFHEAELRTVTDRGDGGAQALATRFAAKEAFGKALGTGLRGFSLREVQITNDAMGKPSVILHGAAKAALAAAGAVSVFVSLTHESDNAVAVIVLEGEG